MREFVFAVVTLLGCLALGVLAAPETIPAPKPIDKHVSPDIDGVYYVEGTDGNATYQGAATIRKLNEAYLVQWVVQGTSALGVGVRTGDVFAVGWKLGDKAGVTVYRIGKDKLTGRWSSVGGFQVRDETLTFLRALPVAE